MGSFKSAVFQMNDCSSKTWSSKELFLPARHDFYFSNSLLIKRLCCFSVWNTNSFQLTCLLFLSEELSNRISEITFLTKGGKKSFHQHVIILTWSESKVSLNIFKTKFEVDLCISLFSVWFIIHSPKFLKLLIYNYMSKFNTTFYLKSYFSIPSEDTCNFFVGLVWWYCAVKHISAFLDSRLISWDIQIAWQYQWDRHVACIHKNHSLKCWCFSTHNTGRSLLMKVEYGSSSVNEVSF